MPLGCEHLVGSRRFELQTSSVSGRNRQPSALYRNVCNAPFWLADSLKLLSVSFIPLPCVHNVCRLFGGLPDRREKRTSNILHAVLSKVISNCLRPSDIAFPIPRAYIVTHFKARNGF